MNTHKDKGEVRKFERLFCYDEGAYKKILPYSVHVFRETGNWIKESNEYEQACIFCGKVRWVNTINSGYYGARTFYRYS